MNAPHELLGLDVENSAGVPIGRVSHVDDAAGLLIRTIVVRAPDGKEWYIEGQHIARIEGVVRLKGPRQGFHLWPQ
ncbi:MAG: hypothetical protein ACYDCK_10145 [Thermoplasmatota archaeon]